MKQFPMGKYRSCNIAVNDKLPSGHSQAEVLAMTGGVIWNWRGEDIATMKTDPEGYEMEIRRWQVRAEQ